MDMLRRSSYVRSRSEILNAILEKIGLQRHNVWDSFYQLEIQFLNLKEQGETTSVVDFQCHFEELMTKVQGLDESHLINFFTRRLKPKIFC